MDRVGISIPYIYFKCFILDIGLEYRFIIRSYHGEVGTKKLTSYPKEVTYHL